MKDKILNNKKCDIIVPIYNSPEWVKLCIYSLIKNTPKECINKIILMNDNSFFVICHPSEIIIHSKKNKLELIKQYTNG